MLYTKKFIFKKILKGFALKNRVLILLKKKIFQSIIHYIFIFDFQIIYKI